MSDRETFKIGPIEIPKIAFPSNFEAALNSYLTGDAVDLGYVASYGIERPELLHDSTVDLNLLRLYATIKFFESNPDNGLAVLEIVGGLADLNDADGAKLVLESLEESGGLHLYPVWYEDPMFHLGWCMADFKRYEEAINAYQKSLSKSANRGKWAVWSHLGSVYHELDDFQQAKDCYGHALESIEAETHSEKFDTTRHIEVIKRLIEQTDREEPYAGKRIQFGIDLRMPI